MAKLDDIVSRFKIDGTIQAIEPLGDGLINATYKVTTCEPEKPDYVLQRINDSVFTDVDLLHRNIETVTAHIRAKLAAAGETDLDRHVLRFIETDEGKTYCNVDDEYWRISVFISNAHVHSAVTAESAYHVGKTFGEFEAMLSDLQTPLGETIPDFHNMEYRLWQLNQAVAEDKASRAEKVAYYTEELLKCSEEMCKAEQLHREGKLPKRICHCDTKVGNMMFDDDGKVLCVIDLDTVMPSFVFSDIGDFLRSAANTAAEDEEDTDNIDYNMDIFKSFIKGYLESARSFLLPVEIENLPYAAALFPYMQAVRFLTDYLNGDTYYSIRYPEHNFVRAKAQFKLFQSALAKAPEMTVYINGLLGGK